jgi:adenylate cyclase
VLFVDLASFTPLTATMGDQAAADVLRRFGVTVRSGAAQHAGRIVKQIGDAFLLTFARPADAIEFGLAMDRFVDAEPQFPALHIGAHHGGVLNREGDYVGGTVNLAARVASSGAAGEFLITEDLREAAGDLADAAFTLLPPRRLKGIADPIRPVGVRLRSPNAQTVKPTRYAVCFCIPTMWQPGPGGTDPATPSAVTSARTPSSKIRRASLPHNKISVTTNPLCRLKYIERRAGCHPRS